MTSLYELPPEEQMELVHFTRARLAEEKARLLREIQAKEEILDKAETYLQDLAAKPQDPSATWKPIGEGWPAFMASVVATPYRDHPDYKPVWDR